MHLRIGILLDQMVQGLPFYSFADDSNIEPYTDINEYLIFDKIVWLKVKEYLN